MHDMHEHVENPWLGKLKAKINKDGSKKDIDTEKEYIEKSKDTERNIENETENKKDCYH
jgi:hypothetical protein